MDATDREAQPLCPSARPEMEGAVIFGVVGGTAKAPRLAHLVQPLALTDELLALAAPASPLAVFRTAAPCAASACLHFAAGSCRLASRIVEELPEAVDGLPACRIRPSCRWWLQEGKAACLRCPLVVTETANPSEQLRHAADPFLYVSDGSRRAGHVARRRGPADQRDDGAASRAVISRPNEEPTSGGQHSNLVGGTI